MRELEYTHDIACCIIVDRSPLRIVDGLGARSVQLWIRTAEPPGGYRYENWTKIACMGGRTVHGYVPLRDEREREREIGNAHNTQVIVHGS